MSVKSVYRSNKALYFRMILFYLLKTTLESRTSMYVTVISITLRGSLMGHFEGRGQVYNKTVTDWQSPG